jgi:hypothetical protein
MGLLIREIVGWVVVVVGLILVGFVLQLALNRSVLEALALSLPATIVFRAGVGLVKLAAAGRMAAAINKDELGRRGS